MKNRKRTIITFILAILILMMISGCSIMYVWMYDDWVERAVGSNSICWEDNDNVIVYCSLTWCYNEAIGVSETTKIYETGGELWRINANTGATELLLRKKGGKYWEINPEKIRIDIMNKHIYISNSLNTYKVKDDYNGWDNIGYFTIPIVSENEKYIVAQDEVDGKTVKKYDILNNTDEILFTNDELIEWLDYDYSRNYLLVNNRKFVNLNTGEKTILVDNNTKIGKYIISSFYVMPSQYGNISNEHITMDVYLRDTLTDEKKYHKIRISIIDTTNKQVLENIQGVNNPDKTKYATLGLFTDTLGNAISTWSLPNDEL